MSALLPYSTLFLPNQALPPHPCSSSPPALFLPSRASSSLPALFAASLLETVTEILEASGLRAGVAGGESLLRLLAIMREAAGSRARGGRRELMPHKGIFS